MTPIVVRPATRADQATIRRMVWGAGLNPVNLRWPNFVVAEDAGKVIGVGQLRPHTGGSRELASLLVLRQYRGRGVGGQIVHSLLAGQRDPIYLMCEQHLEGYYERFGFRVVAPSELPPSLARMHRMGNLMARAGSWLSRRDMRISAMRWDG